MCKFKSAIITKNNVVLAPIYNDSHSALLQEMGINDDLFGATKVFVRAELVPPRGNIFADINKWEFIVDQDTVPEWFEEDSGRYEEEMRTAVAEFVKTNFVESVGLAWTPIKENDECIYYLLYGAVNRSAFGQTNNYKTSIVITDLQNTELLTQLKELYGDRLMPISLDLTTLDGMRTYGKVEGDYLAIPNLDLFRECAEKIPCIDVPWWLATGESTPQKNGSGYVLCVNSDGDVCYRGCCWGSEGVRPFFIVRKH